MIHTITFRVKTQNIVYDLLEKVSREMCTLFCNQIIDEYIIEGPVTHQEVEDIQNVFGNRSIRINNQHGNVVYIYVRCIDNNESHLQICKTIIFQNQGILVNGYQIRQWQHYAVIVFGDKHLSHLEKELNASFEYEIVSKEKISQFDFVSDTPYVKLQSVVEDLTELQLDVIKLCIEREYYQIPRKVTLPELAEETSRSRSSLEKVFRAAENRIMDAIIPNLFVYLQTKEKLES